MIPNDQPARKQMIKRMIEYLIDPLLEDLNEWECDFIWSIKDQIDKGKDLSSKQCEILERIYDK